MSHQLPLLPITVIIPCYRSADTIERAVASVLKQTVLPAQIILVDDASKDKSVDLLVKLKENYPQSNIVVDFLSNNGGPGVARNRGWDLATQPWLAFLDADDAWHPRKLEICWKWIEEHPETMLLGHQTQQVQDGQDLNQATLPSSVDGQSIAFVQMLIANRFYTRAVMLRRDLSFRFKDRRYTEDYLLWLEIILSKMHSYVLNQPLAFSFRPEFSAGGYSGQLWTHEKRELRAWQFLYKQRKISFLTLTVALVWSYIKYLRRALKSIAA